MKKAGVCFCIVFLIAGIIYILYSQEMTPENNPVKNADTINIKIDSITGSYKIAVINDLHITDPSLTAASDRENLFCNSYGVSSAKQLPGLIDDINMSSPDELILNGDILDYFSYSGWDLLSSELGRLNCPAMYLRADHDYGLRYHNATKKRMKALNDELLPVEAVAYREFKDLIIIGINNNTSLLPKEGLQIIKKLMNIGKPVIIAMHVPLKSRIDDKLKELSVKTWGQSLLWDSDSAYHPDETTKCFTDMIYSSDSPVAAVLGAHLHFPYTDNLTENVTQYVLDASYKGKFTIININ